MKSRVILAIAMVMFVVMAGLAFAETKAAETKDIRVEEKEGLKVTFKASKAVYNVGEQITFRAKANKDAYIYVFSVRDDGERATLIFPNKIDSKNLLQAGKDKRIPTKSKFSGDRVGIEHVVVVASLEKLEIKSINIEGSDFGGVEKSLVDGFTKDIRVEPGRKADKVVSAIDVIVKAGASDGAASVVPAGSEEAARPVVLISTDRHSYKIDDSMTISYAADADGYVTIYFINSEKTEKLATNEKVVKNKIYKIAAVTEYPDGDHTLVALFTRAKSKESEGLDAFVSDISKSAALIKDIRIVKKAPDAYATHQFTIE